MRWVFLVPALLLALVVPSAAQGSASIYEHPAGIGPTNVIGSSSVTIKFSDGVATDFECQLDGGGWTPCSNPKTYNGVTDGPHTFGVRTLGDTFGATYTWTTDTTGPVVAFDSGPQPLTTSKSANIAFHWTDQHTASGYTLCNLDLDGYLPCTSPKALGGLTDGEHRFTVVAYDTVGNPSSPVTYEWTVDTTPPDTQITFKPDATTYSASADFKLDAFPEPLPRDQYECSLDGAPYSPCGSDVSYTGLTPGSHTFSARAIDRVGLVDPSPASWTWTVLPPPLAPETFITEGPSGTVASTTALFRFSSPNPSVFFECRLDGSDFGPCSEGYYTDLSEGSHTFSVRAVELTEGVADPTPATRTWIIDLTPDTTPPETTITGGPSGTTSDATPTFEFTSEAGATFECRIDTGDFATCSSPMTLATLTDGTHTFEVRATDAASNTDPTPAARTFTVDTSPGPEPIVKRTLTAARSGTGEGTITSSPSGINCGTDCSETYDEGTVVTLTANPAQSSTFTGWSGAGCSGTSPCQVTLNSDQMATATFVATPGPDPDPDPDPDPAGKPSISAVKVTGPAKLKRGKAATYKVQIKNSGDAEATGVKLKVSGRALRASTSVGSVAAGSTKTVRVKMKPKKSGRIKLTFTVTAAQVAAKSVTKTVSVRR